MEHASFLWLELYGLGQHDHKSFQWVADVTGPQGTLVRVVLNVGVDSDEPKTESSHLHSKDFVLAEVASAV